MDPLRPARTAGSVSEVTGGVYGGRTQPGGTELATAERAGRELTTAAPFRESGFRLLMKALTARGNSAEALLVYDQLVRRLRDELGVPPSAETRVLHASILRTPP